jgi:hypothetical protein
MQTPHYLPFIKKYIIKTAAHKILNSGFELVIDVINTKTSRGFDFFQFNQVNDERIIPAFQHYQAINRRRRFMQVADFQRIIILIDFDHQVAGSRNILCHTYENFIFFAFIRDKWF